MASVAHAFEMTVSSRSLTATDSAILPGATVQPLVTRVSPGHTGLRNWPSNPVSF